MKYIYKYTFPILTGITPQIFGYGLDKPETWAVIIALNISAAMRYESIYKESTND